MPELSGVEFFEMIMADHPNPVRMLLTGHADIDAVIDAINKGRIYKYISKPWNEGELKRLVEEASELHRARVRSSQLNQSYANNLTLLRAGLVDLLTQCQSNTDLGERERERNGRKP